MKGGRWKPIHSNKAPKPVDASSRLGQELYRSHPWYQNLDQRHVPPIEKRKRLAATWFHSLSWHTRILFESGFFGSNNRWQEGILHNVEMTFLEQIFDSFGNFTKRPKNLLLPCNNLGCKTRNLRIWLTDKICSWNLLMRHVAESLNRFWTWSEGVGMILKMSITFGLKTFNKEGKQDIWVLSIQFTS